MKAFLTNRAVNLVNIHTALKRFAISVADLFGAVYLYTLGLSLTQIFLAWCGIFIIRLLIRPFGFWLASKRGLRKSVILGSIFFIGYYLILSQVTGLNIWLFIFIFYAALADTLYWLPYHAYFAALGDLEHRGKQLGFREALVALAATLGPLTSGLLINTYGFNAAFITAAIFTLIAAIPVYFCPEVSIGKKISLKKALKKISQKGFWLFVGDGWSYNAHIFTWNLILFIMLGSVLKFGALLSLAAIFQGVGLLLLGRGIDRGSGKKIWPLGIALGILIPFGRALFVDTVPEVIFFDLLLALSVCFYSPTFNTTLYNTAKSSRNVLWFHFFAEMGWDVGSSIALFTAAILTYLDLSPRFVLFFSAGGTMIVATILHSYFKHHHHIITGNRLQRIEGRE